MVQSVTKLETPKTIQGKVLLCDLLIYSNEEKIDKACVGNDNDA